MMTLSADALALLELHFSRRSLIVGGANPETLPGRTLEETKIAYRELVAAGLMMPRTPSSVAKNRSTA